MTNELNIIKFFKANSEAATACYIVTTALNECTERQELCTEKKEVCTENKTLSTERNTVTIPQVML